MISSWRKSGYLFAGCLSAAGLAMLVWGTRPEEAWARGKKFDVVTGQRLFERVWQPTPDGQAGGDGLGPLFNEHSCIACHFQGGIGGSGPNKNNVALLTFIVPPAVPDIDQLQAELTDIHPGFADSTTVILHRSSNNLGYPAFCEKLLGLKSPASDDPIRQALTPGTIEGEELDGPVKTIQIRGKTFKLSERNTTPLFGLGLIDTISPRLLEDIAAKQPQENPHVHGQFVGRFGWRGQIMNLRDFNVGACAIELGLTVGKQSQAIDPTAGAAARFSEAKADLTDLEVNEMNAFVASLPAPRQPKPVDAAELGAARRGEQVFAEAGCAVCHRPALGRVKGIFSDLLVHEMGTSLSDPSPAPPKALVQTVGVTQYYGVSWLRVVEAGTTTFARNQVWKTPPLWGLRDSGPYLHDGRAVTVEEAILAHDGEGADSRDAFKALSSEEREHLLAFLNTLAAPDPANLPKLLDPHPQTAASAPTDNDEFDAAQRAHFAVVCTGDIDQSGPAAADNGP